MHEHPFFSYFFTGTVDRSLADQNTLWQHIGREANRFIQKLRRSNIGNLEYLQAFEAHKDFYPHVHILLLLDKCYYERVPYVNDRFREQVKSHWSLGLSDLQQPKYSGGNSLVSYVLKYITKSSSANHLWQLLLETPLHTPLPCKEPGPTPPAYAGYRVILVQDKQKLDYCTLKKRKIKLLSWSRGFVNTYKHNLYNEPCPTQNCYTTPKRTGFIPHNGTVVL